MVRLTVHTRPGAPQQRIHQRPDGTVSVWVRAGPAEGQASGELLDALATAVAVRRRQVQILRVSNRRTRQVESEGTTEEQVRVRLAAGTA